MNWFIKLSQVDSFLKNLGLDNSQISLIKSISNKYVRNKLIELVSVIDKNPNSLTWNIKQWKQLLLNNYNTLITLTDNLHYKKWLLTHYLDYPRLEEDKEKFKETLLRLRRSSIDKNINNYQDIPDIARALDNTKNQISKRNKGGELLNLPDGAELLGITENGLTVVKITTIKASNLLADGTEWCVKNEGPAEYYLSKGPLYLIYKNNQRYALCHYEDEQFMDVYDNPLKNKWEIVKEIEPFTGKGIYNDAKLAYEYIEYCMDKNINISGNEIDKLKKIIITNPIISYNYAYYILKGPFPEGEDAIATNANSSYNYATKLLKGSFPKGEDAIATNAECSYLYALNVLEGPFPKGENAIATKDWSSYNYAVEVLKKPFPKGEDAIATNGWYSYKYAKDILKNRFLKGEKLIKQSIHWNAYKQLFNIKE